MAAYCDATVSLGNNVTLRPKLDYFRHKSSVSSVMSILHSTSRATKTQYTIITNSVMCLSVTLCVNAGLWLHEILHARGGVQHANVFIKILWIVSITRS